MDVLKIREDFPLLHTKIKGRPVVYLDSACQSLRPQSVIGAVSDYYRNYSACGGRSSHTLGERVTEKCEETRKTVAQFIKARRKEEIIFTRNTTEGINLVAHSIGLKKGDVVLITDKEHNSNLIPWQVLAQKAGIVLKIVPTRKDNTFDLERFKEMLDEQVRLVSVVHTSNLDGVTFPAQEIIRIAHRHGAKVLLDAAQSIPHRGIDVRKLDVDFLAFSGHKMLGPSGTGVLYGKYRLLEDLEPFMVGGDTVKYSTYRGHKLLPPPAKFEAGLQNYAGIIGLGEAVKYLKRLGFERIIQQEYLLNELVSKEIEKIPGLEIIGPRDPALRAGIISFYVRGIDPHQIALVLDESACIMVRSGQHCAHSWFAAHKIQGSVRLSIYFYNTVEEAEVFVGSLKKVIRTLQ
ncbi:MAG: cysteine desulfurase [Patescibacteria group bacterium]|nr:MAG: cysteine desulfurase [Patescibacteria group bacterium]